jgi:hypothetical protein
VLAGQRIQNTEAELCHLWQNCEGNEVKSLHSPQWTSCGTFPGAIISKSSLDLKQCGLGFTLHAHYFILQGEMKELQRNTQA